LAKLKNPASPVSSNRDGIFIGLELYLQPPTKMYYFLYLFSDQKSSKIIPTGDPHTYIHNGVCPPPLSLGV